MYVKKNESWKKVVKDTIQMIFNEMPSDKKKVLENACTRNAILTSSYGLEHWVLSVYKEGFYIQGQGCRCTFSAWAKDDDGILIFGRKPKEDKLHYLWGDTCMCMQEFDYTTFKFER